MRATLERTFRSFRTRNFRLYYLGLAVSNVGTWLQTVAQAWVVLELTGSGVALGLLAAAQWGPILVFGAWGGVIADRFERRRVILVTQTISGVQALLLGFVVLSGWATVWLIYVFALLLGLVNAVDNPARRAFIPQLVEPGEVSNAMGLNTAVMTSTRIIGPAAAGLLIGTIGAGWCFVANGFSFAAVIVATLALDRSRLRPSPRVSRARGQVRQGLRYAWDDPVLRRTLLAAAVVATLAFNYPTTLPLLTTETFGGDAGTFGALLAVASIGSLLGALVAASRPGATQRFMAGASVAFGLAMGAVASAPALTWAFVLAVPMGAGGSAFASMTSAVLQERSRPEMRGRLMALYAVVFLGSTPIGGPIVGWVGEHVSPRASLYLGALAAVAVGLVASADGRRPSRRDATSRLRPCPVSTGHVS